MTCPLSRATCISVLPNLKILLCTDHHACYTPKTVIAHLTRKHTSLHEQYTAFTDWLGSFDLLDSLPCIADATPPINGLLIKDGFACNIIRCTVQTLSKDTIKRHVALAHEIRSGRVQREMNSFSPAQLQTLSAVPTR